MGARRGLKTYLVSASSKVMSYLHARQHKRKADNALNLPAFINLYVLKKLMSHPALGSPSLQPMEVTTGASGGAPTDCTVRRALHYTR